MRSLLIVIVLRIDCRKNNFTGRTKTNRLSHIYSLMTVVDKGEPEGEKIQFSIQAAGSARYPTC